MIREADNYRKAVTIELFSSVILDTPVRIGRLRGNWQTNEGSALTAQLDRLDPSGAEAINQAVDVVDGTYADVVVHLTNNLPYAVPAEVREAMVAKNMARIEQILRAKK